MKRFTIGVLALLVANGVRAIPPEEAQKLMKEVSPSLVAVQYTYDGELGRREFVGAGVVVSDDGLVMTSIALMPSLLPDQQMKDFKILIPGDEEKEIPATFEGRDERTQTAFIKAKSDSAKHTWKGIKFVDQPIGVGEEAISIGILPKTAAYQAYYTRATVSANLRGETRHVMVSNDGLAGVGSPVFNAKGQAIGWVIMQSGQGVTLNDPNPQQQLNMIYAPPRMFVLTKEFGMSLTDPPVAGQPQKLPWLGVAQMKGLNKEVLDVFGLKGQVAVQVGDVIKGTPAEAAGLKAGNIITKVNGEALERGDEPDEAAMILMKKMRRMKVGEEITFSVIKELNKPAEDVKIKLAERPKPENQATRFYAEDLGFTAREVVFDDTYLRKLPADQKGVVIALVKPAGAAQSAKLSRGDLVTKINQSDVTDIEQFKKEYEQFRKEKPREAVVLSVIRQGQDEIIRIEPPQ
jgi:serine protease Do